MAVSLPEIEKLLKKPGRIVDLVDDGLIYYVRDSEFPGRAACSILVTVEEEWIHFDANTWRIAVEGNECALYVKIAKENQSRMLGARIGLSPDGYLMISHDIRLNETELLSQMDINYHFNLVTVETLWLQAEYYVETRGPTSFGT